MTGREDPSPLPYRPDDADAANADWAASHGVNRLAAAAGEPGSLLVPERLGAWTWVLGYTAILSTLSILRYHLFLATGFDLGIYEQGLWLILHQGLAAVTSYTGRPALAQDASWLLVPLAPLFALGGVGLLLVAQSFALGLGYLLIRRIARTLGVPEHRGHLLAASYLLFPTVLAGNLFDFHPEAILVPILLGVVAAHLEHKRLGLVLLLLSALATSDAAPLPLVALALAFLLRRDLFAAAVTALVAIGGLWIDVRLLLPWAAHAALSAPALLGSTAFTALARGHLAATLRHLRAWEYLAWMLGPPVVLGLSGRSPRLSLWCLPAAAVLTANLATATPATLSPFEPPSLAAVPFLFVACAAAHIASSAQASTQGSTRTAGVGPNPLRLLAPMGVACATLVYCFHEATLSDRALPRNATELTAALAVLPPAAPIVAPTFVLPHVSDRPSAQLLTAVRDPVPAGTFVLLDTEAPAKALTPALLASAVAHHAAAILYATDGVTMYRLLAPLPIATAQHSSA